MINHIYTLRRVLSFTGVVRPDARRGVFCGIMAPEFGDTRNISYLCGGSKIHLSPVGSDSVDK